MPDAFDISRCPRDPVPAITDFGFVTDCALTDVQDRMLLKDCGDLDLGVSLPIGVAGPAGPAGCCPKYTIAATAQLSDGTEGAVTVLRTQEGCLHNFEFQFYFPPLDAIPCCAWKWDAATALWQLLDGGYTLCLGLLGSSILPEPENAQAAPGANEYTPPNSGTCPGIVEIICIPSELSSVAPSRGCCATGSVNSLDLYIPELLVDAELSACNSYAGQTLHMEADITAPYLCAFSETVGNGPGDCALEVDVAIEDLGGGVSQIRVRLCHLETSCEGDDPTCRCCAEFVRSYVGEFPCDLADFEIPYLADSSSGSLCVDLTDHVIRVTFLE